MMSSSFQIEGQEENITRAINDALVAAAEPLVQDALAEIEATMRKALAAHVVGLIRSNYSMERMGNILQITVRQEREK